MVPQQNFKEYKKKKEKKPYPDRLKTPSSSQTLFTTW